MRYKLNTEAKLIVVGAGQHARSLLGVLEDVGCGVVGLVADGCDTGARFAGFKILGGIADSVRIYEETSVVNWVMAIGDNFHRLRIMRDIQSRCDSILFPPVVHSSCVIAPDVTLKEGTVVMPGAVIMPACHVDAGCLINTRSSMDHESRLDEGSSLAPGVIMAGRVSVGRRSFLGIGATVTQGVHIGSDTVLGAGSLLLRDMPNNIVAYGRPAKIIRKRKAEDPYF